MVVRVPTTSLACNSEADVGITIVRPRSCRRHLPCIQQRDGGGFRPRLCHHHLPRVQQRDGGGFRPRSCRPHLPSEEEGEVASGKVASLSYELVCTQDEVARSHVTAPPPTSLVKRKHATLQPTAHRLCQTRACHVTPQRQRHTPPVWKPCPPPDSIR